MDGSARYYTKRNAGISPIRKDGSLTSAENDREAAAAECFAAKALGCKFNDEITVRGDGGYDFIHKGKSIEVIWLGINKNTLLPRVSGHLIVNPDEPQRWADIYLIVIGSIKLGFRLLGWTDHKTLTAQPKKDFGYGLKFALHTDKLKDVHDLLGEVADWSRTIPH